MNLRAKKILLIAFVWSLMFDAFSQSTVSGRVVDSKGEDLPGVTIKIKGTGDGVITDLDGAYSIEVGSGQVLVFSYVGFVTQEVLVANQTNIDVQLISSIDDLQEVVVLGYYTQRRKDLTGAVASISSEDIDESPYSNVLQNLQGRAAGVTIVQDGQPGGGNTNVRIRGLNTINNNNPLYVIDGVPTEESIDFLNSNDIESIQVLKDASSASIYGSRAANGVIVITTKQGKKGKMSVNAGVILGTQSIIETVDVLNASEWGEMYWQASANSGQTPNIGIYGGRVSEPEILVNIPFKTPPNETYPDGQTYVLTREGTDWQDEIYRTVKNNQFYATISSGSEKGSSSFSVSYFDQDGIINQTYYDRVTGRANSTYNINDAIEIGENLAITWSEQVQVGTQSGGGIPAVALRQHPALPIFDLNGSYAGGNTLVGGLAFPNVSNPVSELERNKNNTNNNWRMFGNGYASIDFMKYLNTGKQQSLILKTNFGLDYGAFNERRFFISYTEGGFSLSPEEATYSRNLGTGVTTTWTNTLEYKTLFGGNHNLRVFVGSEIVDYKFESAFSQGSNFISENENAVSLSTADPSTIQSAEARVDRGLRSFFGRLDYDFNEKYLFGATVRYDETSRFNDNEIFPALSFGWRMSDEAFFAPVLNNNVVNAAKLRISWGQQGNQFGRDYPSFTTFQTADATTDDVGADYNISGDNTSVTSGLITEQIGNEDLKWETSKQVNIGLDFGLLKNSLQLSLDYFIITTEDIIYPGQRISAEGEGADPLINAFETQTSGFETQLKYGFLSGLKNWDAFTSLQFFTNKTELSGINQEAVLIDPVSGEEYFQGTDIHRIRKGGDFGTYYGYVVDGIFQSQEEVDAHAMQPGKAPGRLKYRDISGPEGVPDGVINDFDRDYLGSFIPDFTLGWNSEISWKDITLGMFWYASIGGEVYNFTKQNTDFFEPNFNSGARVLDAWTPENRSSSIPAVQTVATNDERRTSSFYVEDASYLKLRSLRLGYNVPTKLTGNTKINVYAEGQNLLIISGYKGLDPEVPYAIGSGNVFGGVDRGIYPLPRMILFGLNIKL